MKNLSEKSISAPPQTLVRLAPGCPARSAPSSRAFMPTRRPSAMCQGTYHGFLELLSQDGQVVAFGDSTQVVHGDRVTSQTTFTFKDGSIDEETAVYSQHRTFQLISDHHVQKGPFFPHPTEVFVDARTRPVLHPHHGKGRQGGVQDQPCSVAGRPRQRHGSPRH